MAGFTGFVGFSWVSRVGFLEFLIESDAHVLIDLSKLAVMDKNHA